MRYKILIVFLLASDALSAQKGMPAKQVVNINHTTNYAQHVDFKPQMLSMLKTLPGWKVTVAASGLGKPRMLLLGDQGQLYITRRDQGDVLMLRDTDGDKKFDELSTVVANFPGVHGIAMKDGWLYLADNRNLKRWRLNSDGTTGTMQQLMDDMPDGGQHPNRTIQFGPDGMLYISVGSTCNDCGESNKEAATMLQVDPTTWKRTVYARGLRNTIGFDFHPQTGEMWGADNGGDAKGDNWPPEELNKIEKDGHYGWPLAYAKQVVDETREDPPGGTKAEFAKTTKSSVMEFTAHSAPIEFKFFHSAPAGFENDALVTWHGSWNRANPSGFKIQHIKFANGKAVSAEDFLSGFLSADARTRFGRPAGLAISNTGDVFVSDDANGIIYRISKN